MRQIRRPAPADDAPTRLEMEQLRHSMELRCQRLEARLEAAERSNEAFRSLVRAVLMWVAAAAIPLGGVLWNLATVNGGSIGAIGG